MIFEKKYGIDLGSSSVKVYSAFRDKIYTSRNIMAYRGRTIIAIGNEAYEMSEKTPADISVTSPMAFGTIADLELQEILLYKMMRGQDRFPRRNCTVFFAVPPDMSALEKRAYYQVANGHWIRHTRVYMVEAPIADALSLGLPFETTAGSMLVNIGDQTTRFSVFGSGRMIMSRMVPIGGTQINESIAQEIRRRYDLAIGIRTANRLKIAMGRLSDQSKDARRVVGMDAVSGLPREEVISSYVVNAGIMDCVNELASRMKTFLERIPPQISYQVAREGIYLTGGSSRIPYLDTYLASYTGFTFNLSSLYENSTAAGLEQLIHNKELKKYAQPISQRKL